MVFIAITTILGIIITIVTSGVSALQIAQGVVVMCVTILVGILVYALVQGSKNYIRQERVYGRFHR